MTFSDRFSPDKNIVNLYRPDWTDQTGSDPLDRFRPVQTGHEWFRTVQTSQDMCRPFQTIPELSRPV